MVNFVFFQKFMKEYLLIVVIFVFLKNIYHFWSMENFVFFQKLVGYSAIGNKK